MEEKEGGRGRKKEINKYTARKGGNDRTKRKIRARIDEWRAGETESMKGGLKFEARISNLRKLLLKHVTHVLSSFFFFSSSSVS